MTALDLSNDAGLVAMVLLTINILFGLLLSARYNSVLSWPHRRLPIFDIHNWTAYIALGSDRAAPDFTVGFEPTPIFASSMFCCPSSLRIKQPTTISARSRSTASFSWS